MARYDMRHAVQHRRVHRVGVIAEMHHPPRHAARLAAELPRKHDKFIEITQPFSEPLSAYR